MTDVIDSSDRLAMIASRLRETVFEPMRQTFVGKDEVIDLLGVALAGGENLFLLGPPGTAKSALVQELGRRLDGQVFDYLLTRFTEPNELFGPFDIRRLREGDLVTNIEGMLPEASFVFLDELLNANSAILNSLLMVLNERIFRRGRETIPVPLLMVVGASNHLPEDDSLRALFDRFLLRVRCDNVPTERMTDVLRAGWRRETSSADQAGAMPVDDIRELQRGLRTVDLEPILPIYVELVRRIRLAGMPVSDRRAVKLQRVVAASALLCGRRRALVSDLWVMRHIWENEEQQSLLEALVRQTRSEAGAEDESAGHHPRSRAADLPDPEELARDLHRLEEELTGLDVSAVDAPERKSILRDKLGLLAGRCDWVADGRQREFLREQVAKLWAGLGTT